MYNSIIDFIARVFLESSHATVIVPLIVLGYIRFNRKIFSGATYLILFSILLNTALKASFRIPLALSAGKEGFAFPSGHMQSSIVLYGWLCYCANKSWIKILIIILLTSIGISLVHFGYHNYYDILGAIFFGLLLIFAYIWLQREPQNKKLQIMLFFSTFLMLYIALIYEIKNHVWIAYIALVSIILLNNRSNLVKKLD